MKQTTRTVQRNPAWLACLTTEIRQEEQRIRARWAAAWLDKLADHITAEELSCAEAVGLLRQEAENIQHQAQELQ